MKNERSVQFQYGFIEVGSIVIQQGDKLIIDNPDPQFRREYDKDSTIILDVGNSLKKGVIDHHHLTRKVMVNGKEYGSATGILSVSSSLISNVAACDNVTIIVHSEPDIDCIAAAYLAKEYLSKGEFPKHYELLVDYVELVDSGKMKMEGSNVKAPFAIITAMGEVLKNQCTSYYDKYVKTMEKGIAFLEFLMDKLASTEEILRNIGLNNTDLLEDCKLYDDEINLLRDDYKTYVEERDNPEICVKRKMRLKSIKDDNKSLIEVDALFWNKVPECNLHKYWARQDKGSPSGNGYTFTFIPTIKDKKLEYSDADNKAAQHLNSVMKALESKGYNKINELAINKVIISVDPNSDVSLEGLGGLLEEAECRKEQKVFVSLSECWRSTSVKRFSDGTCNNSDPWYDGRGFAYTIVDAPRIGSLLTVDEIEELVLTYSKPVVDENHLRFIIPFTYNLNNTQNAEGFFAAIEKNKKLEPITTAVSVDRLNYFVQYIQSYYFNHNKDIDESICTKHFTMREKYIDGVKDIFTDVEVCDRKDNYRYLSKEPIRFVDINVNSVGISLFVYGTGFITVDAAVNCIFGEDRVFLSDVTDYINMICNSTQISNELVKYFDNQCDFVTDYPLIYSYIAVQPNTLSNSNRKEAVYKLCNTIKWDEPYNESQYLEKKLQDSYYETEEFAAFGLSKAGYSIVITNNGTNDSMINKKILHIKNNFLQTDFDIFMLALHQRNTLMNLSNQLSEYWGRKNKRKISELREIMMDFTTMAWFTQVTKNEMGTQLYRSWFEVFENQALYEEVYGQICAMDDYTKAQSTKKFEHMSAIVFPFVIVSTLIQMKFVDLVPFTNLNDSTLLSYLAGWLPIGIFIYFGYRRIIEIFDK